MERPVSDFTASNDTGQGLDLEKAATVTETPLLGILITRFAGMLNAYERNGLIDDSIPADPALDHLKYDDHGRLYADEDLIAQARRASIGIPKNLIHASFGTFSGMSDDHKESARQIYDWVTSWRKDSHKHSLLIVGPTGTGKSHLAVSALKKMVLYGLSPKFSDYRRLLIDLTSGGFDADPVGDWVDRDLVLIDDMGATKASQAQGDKMATILAMRMSDNKPTIITTNDSVGVDKFGKLSSSEKYIDARLLSRIAFSYKFVNTGKLFDWRIGQR